MTLSNVLNMSRQTTYLAILTAGQMLTILCAGFDLSVGSSVAPASVVSSMTMVAFPLGAAGLGMVGGRGRGYRHRDPDRRRQRLHHPAPFFRVSPFVVTLGMMSVVQGLALLASKGVPIFNLPVSFNKALGVGKIAWCSDPDNHRPCRHYRDLRTPEEDARGTVLLRDRRKRRSRPAIGHRHKEICPFSAYILWGPLPASRASC